MSIEQHAFKVRGLSPLLMHNPRGMLATPAGGLKTRSYPSPEEEAETAAYRLEGSGQLYLPSVCFRASLLRGCVGRRVGKYGAATLMQAAVFTTSTECLLLDPKSGEPITDYKVFTTSVVPPKQGRIPRSRPLIQSWEVDLTLDIDNSFTTPKMVEELLDIAGRIAGVGDWRPGKKGEYGRYQVIKEAA